MPSSSSSSRLRGLFWASLAEARKTRIKANTAPPNSTRLAAPNTIQVHKRSFVDTFPCTGYHAAVERSSRVAMGEHGDGERVRKRFAPGEESQDTPPDREISVKTSVCKP